MPPPAPERGPPGAPGDIGNAMAPIAPPERASAWLGLALLPVSAPLGLFWPALLLAWVGWLERGPGPATLGAWLLGFIGTVLAPFYLLGAGRRRSLRRRRGRRLAADRLEVTVEPDGTLRVDLAALRERETLPAAEAPADAPDAHAARRAVLAIRRRRGAWLEAGVLVLPGSGLPHRRAALARAFADALDTARWLARFDDPSIAWLVALALEGPEVPERAADALRRLVARAPGGPETARVRRALLDAPERALRVAAACAVGDRPALTALIADRAAVAALDEPALRAVVRALWRALPEAERGALIGHAEPAVRLLVCAELGHALADDALVELAGDPAVAVRAAAFDHAAGRAEAVALTAARRVVATLGDAAGDHPILRRRWVPDRAQTPPHLRPDREDLVDRALLLLGGRGEPADLRLIAPRLDDPDHRRAAGYARQRIRQRFPEAVDRGELSVLPLAEVDGALSPADVGGGLALSDAGEAER